MVVWWCSIQTCLVRRACAAGLSSSCTRSIMARTLLSKSQHGALAWCTRRPLLTLVNRGCSLLRCARRAGCQRADPRHGRLRRQWRTRRGRVRRSPMTTPASRSSRGHSLTMSGTAARTAIATAAGLVCCAPSLACPPAVVAQTSIPGRHPRQIIRSARAHVRGVCVALSNAAVLYHTSESCICSLSAGCTARALDECVPCPRLRASRRQTQQATDECCHRRSQVLVRAVGGE
jgi:hypothetical protein